MEDIKIKTKNGGIYTQYEDMKPIKDSMQFDSDTEICEYIPADKKVKITIEVRGEVGITYPYYPNGDFNIDYKNTDAEMPAYYIKPSDFPERVKEIIKNGDLWNTDEVYVGNNNWFELFFWDDEGKFLDSDVVDIEGMTPEELCDYCEEVLINFRKDRGI